MLQWEMVLKVDKDEAAKTLDNRDEMHITVPVKKKKVVYFCLRRMWIGIVIFNFQFDVLNNSCRYRVL